MVLGPTSSKTLIIINELRPICCKEAKNVYRFLFLFVKLSEFSAKS